MKKLVVCLFFGTFVSMLFAFDLQKDIIEKALLYTGSIYRTGGVEPRAFDCSGFINFLYKPFVPSMPRISKDMANTYPAISKDALQPGDLVFFATTIEIGIISHVALYLGDGKIIHSISDGPETGVVVTELNRNYWKKHYVSSARVVHTGLGAQQKNASPVGSAGSAGSGGAGAQQKSAGTGSAGAQQKSAGTSSAGVQQKSAGTGSAGTQQKSADAKSSGGTGSASPWDSWDGYIEGDYALWKKDQDDQFNASKNAYSSSSEKSDYETWKNK